MSARAVVVGAFGAAIVVAATTGDARAGDAARPTPEAAEKAREHFAAGKALYLKGAYREALAEVETAHALDPTAGILVYNLAVIHEKLGDIDGALRNLRDYLTMDIDSAERQKATTNIRRLEGAKKELGNPVATGTSAAPPSSTSATSAPAGSSSDTQPPPDGDQPSPSTRGWGRVDAATILTGVFAVTSVGVGTYFGVRAMSDRPTTFVGGVDGTYSDFQQRNATAHTEAIAADVALGVGVLAAGVTAWLFFGRAPQNTETPALSLAPGRDGASLVLGGRF
jgi:tetratricopeptide (TPR) repeat protein